MTGQSEGPPEARDVTEPSEGEAPRLCPWCSAHVSADATHCPACGAALAQRESIGDLVIPGVTSVDPALQAYDAQPLRIPSASRSQGMAGGAIAAAAMGGPIGLAAVGGLAAVAAAEYLGASKGEGGRPSDLDAVGRPSEAALQMVEKLERDGDPDDDPEATQPADADARTGQADEGAG